MFKAYHIRHLFKEVLPKLQHDNDGLIFTPVNQPYIFGTNEGLLKWKPYHTVDFKLSKVHEQGYQYRLLISNRSVYEETEEVLKLDSRLATLVDGAIIECSWDKESNSWMYLRQRTDKPHANDKSVFQKILLAIQNDVSEERLISMADLIKRNWDQRHPK